MKPRFGFRVALASMVSLAPGVSAQDPTQSTVDVIATEGLVRISEQLIRSQIELKTGELYSPRAVARDLRRLYELGYFTQIQVDLSPRDGQNVVTYIFEEQRVIEEVRILGNTQLRMRDIRSALNWKEGDSFTAESSDAEQDAVLGLYSSKGFLNATVDIIVEEISPGRVRLTYIIDAGRKAKIRRIAFSGNEALTGRQLRKLMKTKRRRLILGGKYEEARFEADLRQIITRYGDIGRLEAEIPATEFTYSPNGKKLTVRIEIEEGPEYRVATLEIADNIVYDRDELLTSVEVTEGEVHNKSQVEDDAEALRVGYEDSGYVRARVTPKVTLDRVAKTTHVIHDIDEGELKYVREIDITGNSVTKDEVIRRLILLRPGDRFDGALLRASQNRLEGAGYFETTRMSLDPIEGDDRFENLLVDVEEGKTGSFNFGAGFSTQDRLGGFAEIRLRNFDIANWPTFSGGGQQFSTRINLGNVRSQFNISFTDPEIFGHPISFGIDLFDETVRSRSGSTFSQDTAGAQIRLAKVLSPFVTARTSVRYTDVNISDFGFFFSRQLQELRDPGTTVSTTWGINRNTKDHFRDPTSGAVHDVAIEIAGLGGDNEFVKLQHESIWYMALTDSKKWILSYRAREGIAEPYGSTRLVPLQDRFFAGGTSTVRGYNTRDIGPKVRAFGFFGERESIGGELRVVNNLEVKYKVGTLLRLYGFFDAGGVWLTSSDFDFDGIKTSLGIGIGVDVPALGPLRIDFGFPLNPDRDQGSGRLHLQTSFAF